MRKPLIRFAALMLGTMLAVLTVAPVGVAFAATEDDVIALDEAWFFRYRQPLEPVPQEVGPVVIDDPTGNQADDIAKAEVRNRTNPYPAETLHVGVNASQPEAETFLAWDLLSPPFGNMGLPAILTGGTVTFTDAGSTCKGADSERTGRQASCGSRNAEAADMVACLGTGLIVQTQGGDWKDKYSYDDSDCTPLEPVKVKEGEALQWTASLDQFADTWKDPFAYYGIAVVPNPKITSDVAAKVTGGEPPDPEGDRPDPQQTWHVAFHAKGTDVEDAALITADLEYEKQTLPVFDIPPIPPVAPLPPTDTTSTPTFDTETSFDSGSSGAFTPSTADSASPAVSSIDGGTPAPAAADTPAVDVAAPAGAPIAAPATQATAAKGPLTPWTIWLLPALGLLVAGGLGWSLTQPVELAAAREGAVSKLMKARRAIRPTA